MSDDQFAIVIQMILLVGSLLAAAAAGVVYIKTDREHGGFVFLLFIVIIMNIGGNVLDATELFKG